MGRGWADPRFRWTDKLYTRLALPMVMTPNERRSENPFEDVWRAMRRRDGPALERASKRVENEFRRIERRLAKGVA